MVYRLKYLLLTALILCVTTALYAEDKALITADPFPLERPGQYVYYHDMRTGVYGSKQPVNRLFGLMKADNKQYIIRIMNLKDSKSYLFLGRFTLNKGIMEFYPESTQGDMKEAAVIMADLLNLMNYLGSETVKHAPGTKSRNDLTVNSFWESYNRKLVNSYKWWIPFYKLESSSNSGTDSYGIKGYASLRLVCFGTVAKDDPDMFTRISKLPVYYKDKIPDKKYIIPAAEKMDVKLDNTALKLDKNWHFEKSNPDAGQFQDSYWLKKFTARDAQIGIESIELKNIRLEKNEIGTFVSTLQFQSCVIADTVEIDLKEKTLALSLWDADNGIATFTKYISLGAKNNFLSVLNFSAFDFIYYSNVEYFNSILNRD
jgi:hypothetical protein